VNQPMEYSCYPSRMSRRVSAPAITGTVSATGCPAAAVVAADRTFSDRVPLAGTHRRTPGWPCAAPLESRRRTLAPLQPALRNLLRTRAMPSFTVASI